MPRPSTRPDFATEILERLSASPAGLSSPALRRDLTRKVSQPTLSRLLTRLAARGDIVKNGQARATRYHVAGGRLRTAELRSRLLHEGVAQRLLNQPGLLDVAAKRLKMLARVNPAGRPYQERWRQLLAGERALLLRAMTEDSEVAATMRRESPFTVLYDKKARARLFRTPRP